jgi:hypothetical protein
MRARAVMIATTTKAATPITATRTQAVNAFIVPVSFIGAYWRRDAIKLCEQ